MQQILTANRLGPGEVVYWSGRGGWVSRLSEADPMERVEADQALQSAEEWVRRREIVNPYLFDVRVDGAGIIPIKAREVIRAAGPTVRRDLGKQAGGV